MLNLEVKVDNHALGYEINKRFYSLKIALMHFLAALVGVKKKLAGKKMSTNTVLFDGGSKACRQVKQNAAGWKALETVYTIKPSREKTFDALITNLWNSIGSVQALRNRLRLVKFLIKEAIGDLAKNENEIRILSVASGSARTIIEALSELKKEDQPKVNFKIMLLDKSLEAGPYSQNLAREMGLTEEIVFVEGNVENLQELTASFRPHLIEMIGIFEYQDDDTILSLLKQAKSVLTDHGRLIAGQMKPNQEGFFLSAVVDWPIIYRKPEQFSQLILDAGFNPEECQIIYEPFNFHGVAFCRK